MATIYSKLDKDARRRASKGYDQFLLELAKTGIITSLSGRTSGRSALGKYYPGQELDEGSVLHYIESGWIDGLTVSFSFEGKKLSSYFHDGDYTTETDKLGDFFDKFTELIKEMKKAGEYYIPGTQIPWYNCVAGELKIICFEGDYIAIEADEIIPLEYIGGHTTQFFIAYKGGGKKVAYVRHYSNVHFLGKVNDPVFAADCLLDGDRVLFHDGKVIEGVKNTSDIPNTIKTDKYASIYSSNFHRSDDGEIMFVPHFGMTDMEKEKAIDFYESHGFRKKAASMRAEIREEEERLSSENQKLDEFIKRSSDLLIPVIFHNGDFYTADGAKIYSLTSHTCHGRYDENSPACQYLYGIQEKGWRGHAEKGMLINILAARCSMRNGVLHLNVPKSAMGRIIGTKGVNISRIKEALRKKGLKDLRDIRLHASTPIL